jgi:MSHA biogenesis protein MshO
MPNAIDESQLTIHASRRSGGATLVELVVVIAITGIIAAAVAMFIRRPVEGYIDAVRRAELTDIADTALRRMTRDLRTALPNSIRVDATGRFIEYLETTGGGRYRLDKESDGTSGNELDFSNPAGDGSFDVIGSMPANLAAGDRIVIYNLGPGMGNSDAYTAGNSTTVASIAAPAINISPKQFPFSSPGKRFQVVQHAVTYACNPGIGELRRHWNYGIVDPQQTPPAGGSSALLATNVSGCSFIYTASGTNQRIGVVGLQMQITIGGESVRLFQQAHVSNVP